MSWIEEMNPRKVKKMTIYDAFLLIQVDIEAIKSVNQKGSNLLSETHGRTCTEDTLRWRHQDCLQSISKLWMTVSSEQHCSFGWEAWLPVEEINMH